VGFCGNIIGHVFLGAGIFIIGGVVLAQRVHTLACVTAYNGNRESSEDSENLLQGKTWEQSSQFAIGWRKTFLSSVSAILCAIIILFFIYLLFR
jgi:hypothetical protein